MDLGVGKMWRSEDLDVYVLGGLAFPGALDKGLLVREAHVWLS